MAQTTSSLRLLVSWGDVLYDTVLCAPHETISVGRGKGNTFHLNLGKEFPESHLDLIKVTSRHSATIRIHDIVKGHVRLKKGVYSLSGGARSQYAKALDDGLYEFSLSEPETAELTIGYVTFYLDWAKPTKRLPKAIRLDKSRGAYFILLALISAPFLLFLQSTAPLPPTKMGDVGRVVTIMPEKLRAPAEIAPAQPEKKKETGIIAEKPLPKVKPAALGQRKTADGGAQKGAAGKATLAIPQKKNAKAKTGVPSMTAGAKVASPDEDIANIDTNQIQNVVEGLTSIDTKTEGGGSNKPPPQGAYLAPIEQKGSGGFSLEGAKKGAGGSTVGIGRPEGKGEGGFGGLGKSGLGGALGSSLKVAPSRKSDLSSVGGGLDREMIEHVVRQRKDRIRLCYERQLNFIPQLSGKVTVHFEIDPKGNVLSSNLIEDTLQNKSVKECILSEVKSWTFPKPQGGVIVPVDYPFVFESSSLGKK